MLNQKTCVSASTCQSKFVTDFLKDQVSAILEEAPFGKLAEKLACLKQFSTGVKLVHFLSDFLVLLRAYLFYG